MSNRFTDMRYILICYANAAEEIEEIGGDENEIVIRFSAKVQTFMGMSMSRKIQALAYLFDNQLGAVANLSTTLQDTHSILYDDVKHPPITKEEAFTALQMAITAQAVNYQNGDNS